MARPKNKSRFHIFKRKDKTFWMVWWINEEGIRETHSTGFDKTFNKEYVQSKYNREPGSSADMIKYSIGWLEERTISDMQDEGISKSTINLCKNAFHHFKALYDPCDITTIDKSITKRMHRYFKSLSPVPSNATINIYLRQLQKAFERLVFEDIIPRNPLYRFQRLPENKRRAMNQGEQKTFSDALLLCENEDFVRLMNIYRYTGLRCQEILLIDRENVDLEAGTFRTISIKKRGIKPIVKRPIPENIWSDFKYFMDKYADRKFPFKICHEHTLTHRVKAFYREIGLPEDLNLHSNRHTFTDRVVNEGIMTVWEAKCWLDHSDQKVTEGYIHDVSVKAPKIEF